MSLPREVLELAFSHLEAKDLLQCQLTSNQWHKVSLRRLYSHLLGDTEEKAAAYVRTITYSPQLGEYLNTIDFKSLFYQKADLDEFDKVGLLDTIIKYCPNITKMDGLVDDIRFWPRLMYAATQGQLSRLATLPVPEDPSLKSYINVALIFKNALTNLSVNCDKLYSQLQLADSDTNITLYNQIDQFKKLNALCVKSNYIECLSYFDELIDKYHNLKSLYFYTFISIDNIKEIWEPNELRPTILPRPDIQTFGCFWNLISEQGQLEYLMRKFPNLQCLKLWPLHNEEIYWDEHAEKLIQYALSLPDFEIRLEVTDEIIWDFWNELAQTNNVCQNVTLDYLGKGDEFNKLELTPKLGLRLKFVLYEDQKELPHVPFLFDAGKSLRSVIIGDASVFRQIIDETSTTMDWLFDILQLCPLLKELTIGNPTSSSPIHYALRLRNLKKLTIVKLKNIQSIDFLHCLSLSLPNLRQLSLSFNGKNMDPIIIDTPHTSFDLVIWNEELYNARIFKESEVYIKLNTDKGLEYYLGERNMLVPISESRYLLSLKNVRFDISCKHLKELRIRRAFPKSDLSFVFQP